ncbi:hypothetical protein HGRIS_000028 [Hohenbuehelia grisea]|uniref:F-box domain-containing protein n=1 Tax=Hohenbuehelia grisea TaxID=104357 RepID=A0ABR3JPU6_9AGAR
MAVFVERFVGKLLTRSRTSPLQFALKFPPKLLPSVNNPILKMWNLVISRAEHWDRVNFCITPDTQPLLSALKGRLDVLQHLVIDATRIDTNKIEALDAFAYFPRLTSFRSVRYPLYHLNLPWDQLREVDITDAGVHPIHILRRTPLVETAEFTGGQHSIATAAQTSVLLPHLHTLLLVPSNDPLPYLTLPALKNTLLPSKNTATCFRNLSSLILRSACALESFSIAEIGNDLITVERLIEALHRMPSLTRLRITSQMEGCSALYNVLALRATDPSSFAILPQLQHLHVHVGRRSAITPSFVTFIEARENREGEISPDSKSSTLRQIDMLSFGSHIGRTSRALRRRLRDIVERGRIKVLLPDEMRNSWLNKGSGYLEGNRNTLGFDLLDIGD